MNTVNEMNQNWETMVVTAISNLCISCLKEHEAIIKGIYLAPYKIGENKKIEIVVVKQYGKELVLDKSPIDVNNLQIFLNVRSIGAYQTNPQTNYEYKLCKDLKTGIIIYDPDRVLDKKKNKIDKNGDIVPFYNSTALSKTLSYKLRKKVYAYNKH